MGVWFTSDHHIGHRSVAYARRYGAWPPDKLLVTPDDVVWHDDMLAANWDARVRKDDVVWVLGDLTANNKEVDRALEWIRARPGRKHFIAGNHDPVHPMHTDAHKWQWKYVGVFDSVQMAAKRTIRRDPETAQLVLLSHFPYDGDGEGKEDRCSQWRLRNGGYALLHGHVHSKEKVTYAPPPGCADMSLPVAEHFAGRVQQIHVGVDAWGFAPVHMDDVAEVLFA